jgi:hypothetical protein
LAGQALNPRRNLIASWRHHLAGNAIRFLFIGVTRFVHHEFGLETDQAPSSFAIRALLASDNVIAASAFALQQAGWGNPRALLLATDALGMAGTYGHVMRLLRRCRASCGTGRH